MKNLYIPKGKTLHYETLYCQNIVNDGTLIVDGTLHARSISGNTGDENSEKKSSENSEQTEHRNSVKTADHMSPGSWLTALVFTASVITMCLILMWFRKRRSYDEKQ